MTTQYTCQVSLANNTGRSEPMTGSASDLAEAFRLLLEDDQGLSEDDIVIVISESEDGEKWAISTKPLVTCKAFHQLMTQQAKLEATNNG